MQVGTWPSWGEGYPDSVCYNNSGAPINTSHSFNHQGLTTTRGNMAQQYSSNMPYQPTFPDESRQYQQQDPFNAAMCTFPQSSAPLFPVNYIQSRPNLHPVLTSLDGLSASACWPGPNNVTSQATPIIKTEPHYLKSNGLPMDLNRTIPQQTIPTEVPTEIEFKTEVDNLVKVIQSKSPGAGDADSPSGKSSEASKKHICNICAKVFPQKTHLKIHLRKHSGLRPYKCPFAHCQKLFTQSGNLITHERAHRGEKPFVCHTCGKGFTAKGNLRAHEKTHSNEKQWQWHCKFVDCGKLLSTLGNLKYHQNKYHASEIAILTAKFSNVEDLANITEEDRVMWDYFKDLYKNSNKGIKGRGKGCKVATVVRSQPSSSNMHSMSRMQHIGHLEDGSSMHMGFPSEFSHAHDVNSIASKGRQQSMSNHGSPSGSSVYDVVYTPSSGSSYTAVSPTSSAYSIDATVLSYAGNGQRMDFGDRMY